MFANEINVLVSDLVHEMNVHIRELHWLAAAIGPGNMVSDTLLRAFAQDDGSITQLLDTHLPCADDDLERFHEMLFHKERLGWLAQVSFCPSQDKQDGEPTSECRWLYADGICELIDKICLLATNTVPGKSSVMH